MEAGQEEGAVSVGGAICRGEESGAVGREVLVELVDVEGLDGADDVGAELGDVHDTEVDVLTAPCGGGRGVCGTLTLVFVPHVEVCFWSSWRRWRSVRLTWKHQGFTNSLTSNKGNCGVSGKEASTNPHVKVS